MPASARHRSRAGRGAPRRAPRAHRRRLAGGRAGSADLRPSDAVLRRQANERGVAPGARLRQGSPCGRRGRSRGRGRPLCRASTAPRRSRSTTNPCPRSRMSRAASMPTRRSCTSSFGSNLVFEIERGDRPGDGCGHSTAAHHSVALTLDTHRVAGTPLEPRAYLSAIRRGDRATSRCGRPARRRTTCAAGSPNTRSTSPSTSSVSSRPMSAAGSG